METVRSHKTGSPHSASGRTPYFISLDLCLFTYQIKELSFNVLSPFMNHWSLSWHLRVQIIKRRKDWCWLFWGYEKESKIQKVQTNRCFIIERFRSYSRFIARLLCFSMLFSFPVKYVDSAGYWEDPEGLGGVGGGRGDRDGEYMYIHGWFMSMYDKNHYNIVK